MGASRETSDLVAAGRYIDALDALSEANRRERTSESDRSLVRLRHQAFDEIARSKGLAIWPRTVGDPFLGTKGLVEVNARDLDVEILSGAILHHGCLMVRGLLTSITIQHLIDDIDKAFAAQAMWRKLLEENDSNASGGQSPWFEPFSADIPANLNFRLSIGRKARNYRVLLADSPPTMFDVCDALELAGVRTLVTNYFGQRPAMTVSKSALRRLPSMEETLSYHQDIAAFRSQGARAINFWVSLSECGEDSPGIEILPLRVDHAVARPGDGYSLTQKSVAALGATVVPVFEPGDALVFDDLLIHRTAIVEGMTRTRYSMENWFFAPLGFPLKEGPMVF